MEFVRFDHRGILRKVLSNPLIMNDPDVPDAGSHALVTLLIHERHDGDAGSRKSLAPLWHNAGSEFPGFCDGDVSENQKGEANHTELTYSSCAGKEHRSRLSA